MEKGVYTILLERIDGWETFINQVSAPKHDLDTIVDSWSRLIIEQGLIQGKDIDLLLEELDENDNYENFVPINTLSNIWCGDVLLSRYYFVYIIESETVPLQKLAYEGDLLPVTQRQKAYKRYEKAYHNLKRYSIRDTSCNRERKKAERWMRYWAVKEKFLGYTALLKGSKDAGGLYTFLFEYARGTAHRQLWLSSSHLNLMLVACVERILQEVNASDETQKTIDKEVDRLLLMERAMDENYHPEPISGLVNVWSTYFTLSKGLGNLTIVKTCP